MRVHFVLTIPKDEETALAAQVQDDFLEELARVESTIDIEDFNSFPVEDDVTFDAWVRRNESWDNPLILAVAAQLTTGIVGREPRDVGAHYWFDYLQSGGGWQALLGDDEEGAQRQMIKTGENSAYVRAQRMPLIMTRHHLNRHQHPRRPAERQRPDPLPRHQNHAR